MENFIEKFVDYHTHTHLSNPFTILDSIDKFTTYVDMAKKNNMTSIAFSEHGNVLYWVKKKEYVEKMGMKYIHSIEMYVTESLQEKKRDNHHVILIAKNWNGVREINELSSKSFNREDGHFYYNPRITFEELINTSDNIIICTACLGGILHSGNNNLKNRFIKFLSNNNHRCFLEIQHHSIAEQKVYNKYLYELSKKNNIPLIAGTDSHYSTDFHRKGRISLQKRIGIHFDNEDGWDL